MPDMLDDDPFDGKVKLWASDGNSDGSDIVLYELKNGNLILTQHGAMVILSWDELLGLSEFYEDAMDELEKRLAINA